MKKLLTLQRLKRAVGLLGSGEAFSLPSELIKELDHRSSGPTFYDREVSMDDVAFLQVRR